MMLINVHNIHSGTYVFSTNPMKT